MRNLLLGSVGLVCALFMSIGRWAFGVGGELTWWYVPAIGVPYLVLHLFAQQRATVAEARGRHVPRKFYVALALSWACALAFGFTVPDLVNGELVTITSQLWGDGWVAMSIALCNPFGIIAFATVIAALVFGILAGRDPRPTEDDLLDAAEVDGELKMVDHPLTR